MLSDSLGNHIRAHLPKRKHCTTRHRCHWLWKNTRITNPQSPDSLHPKVAFQYRAKCTCAHRMTHCAHSCLDSLVDFFVTAVLIQCFGIEWCDFAINLLCEWGGGEDVHILPYCVPENETTRTPKPSTLLVQIRTRTRTNLTRKMTKSSIKTTSTSTLRYCVWGKSW
jgi:hypothetical protein